MQAKKIGRLLHISSQSEQQQVKTAQKVKQSPIKTIKRLKYETFKSQFVQLKKNIIKDHSFEEQYIFQQRINLEGSKPIRFISEEVHQIETVQSSIKEKENHKFCWGNQSLIAQPQFNNKEQSHEQNTLNPELSWLTSREDVRKTVINKNKILSANFETDSEDDENKVQIEAEMNKKDQQKYQTNTNIIAANWNSSLPKEMLAFKKVNENESLNFRIQRQCSGMKFFAPHYNLVFGDESKHLLSCKKKFSSNLQCIISLDKNDIDENSQNCIGKVIGNFTNDIFHVIDKRKRGIICTTRFRDELNTQMVLPKCYQIFMLNQNCEYSDLVGGDFISDGKGLDQLYLIPINKQYITYFRNRKPQYYPKIGAFMINFGGRVKEKSIKNFMLEDYQSARQILMFGKQDNENFNIYVSGPLSPFLALGIVIPHFATKLLFK